MAQWGYSFLPVDRLVNYAILNNVKGAAAWNNPARRLYTTTRVTVEEVLSVFPVFRSIPVDADECKRMCPFAGK